MGGAAAAPRSGKEAQVRGAATLTEAVKRYEVRWAALNPADRAEMAKTRPVVIVSLDALNERLQTITVCPLTTQLHPAWRTRLGARVGRRNAEIAVDLIRTIGKSRIGRKLATRSDGDATALRRLITEMYGE
jgi:mRNA interferase MazF